MSDGSEEPVGERWLEESMGLVCGTEGRGWHGRRAGAMDLGQRQVSITYDNTRKLAGLDWTDVCQENNRIASALKQPEPGFLEECQTLT